MKELPYNLKLFCRSVRIREAPGVDQSYIGWLLMLENDLLFSAESASKKWKSYNRCGANYQEDYRRRPLLEWVEKEISNYKSL